MSLDINRIRRIRKYASTFSVLLVLPFFFIFQSLGAQLIASIIISLVISALLWYTVIFVFYRIFVPKIEDYTSDAEVSREYDDIEVKSSIIPSGNAELDAYIQEYIEARDWWGKTAMLVMVAFFTYLLTLIFD